ncbi:MAG: hypothetical protein M3T96_07320, partial [Acidobacteriota bacterium]|nr:hypothetical protein [Acidobacteriota bacterium]
MEIEDHKKANGDVNGRNSSGGEHLSDEEIIAYHYGNLSSVELEQRAQNHLIECRRCTNSLLEFGAFADSANLAPNIENTDAQWAQFEERRFAESKFAAPTPIVKSKNASLFRNGFFGFPSFNFAAAAAFGVLIIVALGAIFLAVSPLTQNPGVRESAIALNTPPIVEVESITPEMPVSGEKKNASDNNSASENSNHRIFDRANQNSSPPPSKTKNKAADENSNSPAPTPKIKQTPAFQDELALNTMDVSLYPNEAVRGAENVRKIRVKQNSVEQIRLKLNAPPAKTPSAFSVEIVNSQNKTLLTLPI